MYDILVVHINCAQRSLISDLNYVSGSVHENDSTCFWYSYMIINCLLTMFVNNYGAQLIYHTYVS